MPSSIEQRRDIYLRSLAELQLGPPLVADRLTFAPGLPQGALIATLSAPFGADTTYQVVGGAPPELALVGNRIVAGATSGLLGRIYTIKVRATSADGKRDTAETLVFLCVSIGAILSVFAGLWNDLAPWSDDHSWKDEA